jgi:hypothetical protein
MKTPVFILIGLVAGAISTPAQQYSIPWFTVDGGGGTATNAAYSLTGTLGQPDAGFMSGGGFTLVSGFWGIVAPVQTPGAPNLSISRLNNSIRLTWPGAADGWLLQTTTNLLATTMQWTDLPPPYQTQGTNTLFTEPWPHTNRFYRLHKP